MIKKQQIGKLQESLDQLQQLQAMVEKRYETEHQQLMVMAGRYVRADQAAYWDGRTEDGEMVASGTYFYQLQAGDYLETIKMVILK